MIKTYDELMQEIAKIYQNEKQNSYFRNVTDAVVSNRKYLLEANPEKNHSAIEALINMSFELGRLCGNIEQKKNADELQFKVMHPSHGEELIGRYERALKLLEEGNDLNQIAVKMQVSKQSAVRYLYEARKLHNLPKDYKSRQWQVELLMNQGKSMQEISKIMNLHVSTVGKYIQKIKKGKQ